MITKVAFAFNFKDRGWLGGINYYRNLLSAVYLLENRKIEPIIFVGRRMPMELLENFPPFEIVKTSILDRKSTAWYLRKIWHRVTGRDYILERLLVAYKAKALSHHYPLGSRAKIPVIGWIADFQHKHLPQLFTDKEISLRDYTHRAVAVNCACVILSSFNAQEDFSRYYPQESDKTKVLQFVSEYDDAFEWPDEASLRNKYSFSGPYFHLPGQFWEHKNHVAVIEALHILKRDGVNVTVIATGNTADYRNPGFFENVIKRKIAEYGLEQNFRILGIVPHTDLFGLMKGSVAIINPSRFEGWSTTVEEAKAMDKMIILSSIAVHREQAPAKSIFFDQDSPAQLASAIVSSLADVQGTDPAKDRDHAQASLMVRRRDFAKTFQEIILGVARTKS